MGRPASANGFKLDTDLGLVLSEFQRWRDALVVGAEREGRCWNLRSEDIQILELPKRRVGDMPGLGFMVGLDSVNVAVEMNPPNEPGTVDGGTQIGTDPQGRRWVFRQGSLQLPGNLGSTTDEQFAEHSGLGHAFETPATDRARARRWFRVCCLSEGPDVQRTQTAAFAKLCQQVRDVVAYGVPPADPSLGHEISWAFTQALEPAGTYTRPAQPESEVRRVHALVVNLLIARLAGLGANARKAKHCGGYEADLVVEREGQPDIMVEVKTGITSGDVQQGVGQLMLYRKLFATASGYQPILLLPATPNKHLLRAVRECGVDLHWYRWMGEVAGEGEVHFSDEFLSACIDR